MSKIEYVSGLKPNVSKASTVWYGDIVADATPAQSTPAIATLQAGEREAKARRAINL
ncbi:hypothetical protein G6K93_31285 [Agrobacterium rhizogenes]|uniref:Uncharacterized protein n=1 Tax=Rhizobium rhizogenes TaxID=359 RepID=A0A7S4ZSI9_RHIRH|nr:hypothetical protein [Rhizobium rhizogenes]NTF59385.1 hypothetical protein [Rhizobium rhizogenes]NTF78970.1 hypothetical protein [Rhizobium rhizogenes]NTJ51499.1 hypothetical protein [Rhizobium rhizogenes]QCL10257.1 hypothetical protein pC6.5b_363 [Rhizobium rhizogenes]